MIGDFVKKYFKKFFPGLYYSEKLQKFWFYLMLPSPIKIVIFLVIVLIIVLIWGGFSTDDPMTRLHGISKESLNEIP